MPKTSEMFGDDSATGPAVVSGTGKQNLQASATSWAARARNLVVSDVATCVQASEFLKSIKAIRQDIATWFAPHIEAAMETKRKADAARKALVDERDRMEAPLVEAEIQVKRELLAYDGLQERQTQLQEQQLQAQARQLAEQQTLEAAADLEREGRATGDAEMIAEAESILAQPIDVPVISVQKSMPKVTGIAYRDHWKAKDDVDVKVLAAAIAIGQAPVTFLSPNMSAINAFARATQGLQPVAGVQFWNDRQIAARG